MASNSSAIWWLYCVRTHKGHLYTGITTDVERRFEQHCKGTGAKALKGKGPLTLVISAKVGDRSQASKLEYQFKQLSKSEKELRAAGAKSFQLWINDSLAQIQSSELT